MEETNPLSGLGPVVSSPARNPNITLPLDYYPNEYDTGYREGYNQVWNRSANQSGGQALGYGLLSRTISIIPKVGAGLGSILGAGSALVRGDVTDIWDNPINNWFNSLDEGLKEKLPVYPSQKNETSGLVGKMATASFWASDAFDGLAYAASAFIPGTLIGKATAATGAAMKASDVGRTLLKGLDAIGANAHRTSLTLSTAYNTISEASAEAFQTQKELEAIYLNQGLDPAQAKLKAGESAARVFNANMAVLAVPNLVQNTFFHGGWNKLQKQVRDAVGKTGDLTGVKELSESWAKAAGISVASEGFWEENIQTTIQQWEKNAAKSGNIGDKRTEEIATNYVNNIGSFFNSFIPGKQQSSDEIEAATSIFLGGVIGLGAATKGHFSDKAALSKLGAEELERYNYKTDASKAATGIMVDNVKAILKHKGKKTLNAEGVEVEVTDYELDPEGNTVLDNDAVEKMVVNSLRDKSFWDAHMIAAYRNDPALAELNKHMALGSYVYNLMNTSKYEYSAQEVSDHLDKLTEVGNEEAKTLGLDTYIQQNMATAKQFAQQFESIRAKHSSIAKDSNSKPEDVAFNDYITKTEFYLELKKKALETILQNTETEQGRDSVTKLLEDNNEYLRQVKNERASIRKEFNKGVISRETKRGELSSTKNQDRKKALEYELAEDAHINGEWSGINNSRELPPQEARLLTKVKPGTRDSFQYGLGKSIITTDRVTTALANNEDISDIADKFADGIKVIPKGSEDLVKTQQQEILGRLTTESKSVMVEGSRINNILISLPDIDESLSANEAFGSAFGIPDEGVQAFLSEINLKGTQFNLDTPAEEVMASPQYQEYISELAEKLSTVKDQLGHIGRLQSKVSKMDLDNKRLDEYQKASDKDEFLKKEFYNDAIKEGAEAFIRLYEKNPDELTADNLCSSHIYRLESAALGSDIESVVEDAKEKLLIFSKIWNKILDNINNRAEIHRIINGLVTKSILESLPIEAISKALGKETLPAFIDKIQTQDYVTSFDAIVSLLGEVKKQSDEVIKQTKASIKDSIDAKVLKLIDTVLSKYPELEKLAKAYRGRGDIQDEIYLPTQALLTNHFTRKYGENVPPEYTRFTADLDMFLFHNSISKSRSVDAEDKELVRQITTIYFDAIGANIAQGVLDSKLDVSKLEKFKENMGVVTPSLQQNIALTQAITFLSSKQSFSDFGGWLLVRGIGGSGKTFFLGNQVKALSDELLGRESKILAFSKEDGTSANINEAIFGGNAPRTKYSIFNAMSDDVLAELDFIVIDEVFTFTNAELQDIRARAANAKVKIIALGDASQLTAEEEPAPLAAIHINMTIPLTTSYRTNVSSISSFIDRYRLNPDVVEAQIGSSNVTVEDLVTNPSTAYGVISVTPEQLDVALHTPTARSRVLIVPNQQAKANLQSRYPTLEIRTPSEAQGIQWDEVYSTLENGLADTPFESNRILYTGYSRAKFLLVVVDPTVSNASPSTELEFKVKNSDIELDKIKEMFSINMKGVEDLRNLLNGVQAFSQEEMTKDEVVYEFEPPTDASISNAMGTDLIVSPPDLVDPVNTQHKFMFPKNFGLIDWGIQGDQRLARGSRVHFIKTKSPSGKVSIYVVAKNQHSDKGLYFEVAKLDREDFEGSARVFLNEVSKSSTYIVDESEIKGRNEFPIPDIERVSAGSVTVTDYLKFKTLYSPTYRTERDLTPGASDIIEDAIIRAWYSYKDLTKEIEKPWVTTTNGITKVNWDNIQDSASMLIPTKNDTKAADGFGWKDQEHIRRDGKTSFSVAYGVPYLVLYLEGKSKKPILIRFQPKPLNSKHRYVSVLRDLQTNVDTIERLTALQLGTEPFAELIRNYAQDNFTAESGILQLIDSPQPIPNVPQSTELEDAVRNVVKLIFTAENKPRFFRSEENAKKWLEENGTPVPDSDDRILDGKRIVSISQAADKIWVYNYSTDPVEPNSTAVYTVWKVSEGSGPAQVALNSLAQANNRVRHTQLRQTEVRTQKTEVIKIVRTPTILRNFDKQPYRDYIGFYKDPYTAEYLTQEQIDSFLARATKIQDNPKLGEELLDTLAKSIMKKEVGYTYAKAFELAQMMTDEYMAEPITSWWLDKLVGERAFDANGEHTQLRTPLQLTTGKLNTGINDLGKNLKDETNRNLLTQNVRHNFEGFQKTEIFFNDEAIAAVELPKVDTKPTTIKDLIAKIKPTGNKVYDDIVALLKKLKTNATVIHLPNGVAYTNSEGNPATKTAASTVLVGGNTTVYSHGFKFGNFNRDHNELRLFLHESLHVASQEALEKGREDVKNKLDTKEATFYRRIQALQKRFNAAIRAKRDPITGKRLKISDIYEQTTSELDVNEFVASLSNPTFVELAKTISVTSETKFLRKILEAIVDFFKSILGGNPSIYDAAIASLEEFYSTKEVIDILPEYVAPEVVYKPTELILDLTNQINKQSEFRFDAVVKGIKEKWKHVIDESSLPKEYGDDFTIELSSEFNKLSALEQSLLLGQAKVSGAWYDITKDKITYSTGAIGTTVGIPFSLNKLMENTELVVRQRALVQSIVRQEALGNRNLGEILASDVNEFIDFLFEKNIFSNRDKQQFRIDIETNTDLQTREFLKDPTNGVAPALQEVLNFLKVNEDAIAKIIELSRDRSTNRYRIAKQYVERLIKANLDIDKDPNPTQLIQTTPYVKQTIENLVNDDNPVLLSGLTLAEAEDQLEQLYAKVKNYTKASSDPYERNKILFVDIPQLENEITAMKALSSKDSNTGEVVLDLIFKDIYPNSDFSEVLTWQEELYRLAEEEYISQSELDTEDLELSGIAEHVKKYDQSYELTLSESLKNSFRRITLGDRVISPALAYIKTMQLVMSLDWNIHTNEDVKSRELGLPYIARQLETAKKETSSKLGLAIINNLLEIISYSYTTSSLDGVDLNFGDRKLGIVQIKGEDNTIQYAAYNAHSSLRAGLTYKEIEYELSQGKDVKLSDLSKDTAKLAEWLYNEVPHSIKQFNRLFAKGDAINTARAVVNTMASMKETNLYSANRSNNKGNQFTLQRGIASGVSMKIKEQLRSNLVTFYEKGELPSLKVQFNALTVGGVRMDKLKESKKLDYIKNFFNFLGIPVPDIELQGKSLNSTINKIEGFLERTGDVKDYTLADDLGDGNDDTFDILDFLSYDEGVDGYLSDFAAIAEKSDKLVRNQSVRDVNGKKFYKNHESSHFYKTLLNLIEVDSGNPVFKGGTGNDWNRIIPDFLKSTITNPEEVEKGSKPKYLPSYYDHNIFVRGIMSNKMYSIAEIDGARNTNNNSVTEYTRENMFYFFHRNFAQQFLDGVRQHRNTYFQSTFIPSDAPKALAIRIGILSDEPTENGKSPILQSIEQMFQQLLPRVGLNGAKFKQFDASIRDDLFRNFKLGAKALKDAKDENGNDLPFIQENIPQLARFVYAQMSIEASNLLGELMSTEVELSLDINSYLVAQRLLPSKVNGKEVASKLNTKLFPHVLTAYGSGKHPTRAITRVGKKYEVDRDLLLPIFDLWFKNNYVNSYFMNQLVTGDYAAHKSSGGIIKRYGSIKGPGVEGLIDPVVGMRPFRNTLVLGDKVSTKEDAKSFFSNLLYGKEVPESTPELDAILAALPEKFNPTDAQGFMTTKWIAELSRGFESSWGIGAVSKPLGMEIQREIVGGYTTGKPVLTKYSATALDDAFTAKFPRMAKLRRALEILDIDEAIHESGTKLGVPLPKDANGNDISLPTMEDLINYTDEQLLDLKNNWKVSPILKLSNAGYRMQFNAASDPNTQVSLFTQLMYFLNTYPDKLSTGDLETTQDAAKEVYNLIGELIQVGREDFMKSIGNTKEGMIKYLKKNLRGAGSERALALLEAGVSLDNPLIEKKAIITLTSGLEKATIKTKFKGGKLVLQTPEGITKYELDSTDYDASRLTYKKEVLPNGSSIIVAECIVPKELLTKEQQKAVKEGKTLHLMPDMLGFRLPSTEFHSALAIRVVGVYSAKKSNVIIAPREMVPIQGQDFDVDSLFVITQETFKESETKLIDGVQLAAFADILHELLHDLKAAHQNVEVDGAYKGKIKKLMNEIKEASGLSTTAEDDTAATVQERVDAILDKFKNLPADLISITSDVMDHLIKFKRILLTTTTIGEMDAPVGYTKEKGKYVIDTSFLQKMNDAIASLESITGTNEIMPSLSKIVRAELNKVKSLKQKYIKNRVIDIMMSVISDSNNADRSFTAISFTPLKDAIANIPEALVTSNENLDLSHPKDQFLAYLSVSSGQTLIGGFANASKWFGYVSRAGGNEALKAIFNIQVKISKAIKDEALDVKIGQEFANEISNLWKDITGVDLEIPDLAGGHYSKSALEKLRAEVNKAIPLNIKMSWTNQDSVPILNAAQSFSIQEGGKTILYDKLAQIDSDGIYKTTQSFSTLTNAAVDDLNEGYLSRAKINTNTGSAIIGLTALGVPFRVAIKILYQPVLSTLTGGKLNNLEDWIKAAQKLLGSSLEEASEETLNVERDLDSFIDNPAKYNLHNMDIETMFKEMSPQDKQSQLRVLALFIKANKIGTDGRNLASFLNILRQWKVFIEDIEEVDDTLTDKIGTSIVLPSGELALQTRNDFSFNIPNLFEGSRHIKEAYMSHRELKQKIRDTFLIHSPQITGLAEDVNSVLDLKNKDKKNVTVNSIRHSIQHYISVGIESTKLPDPEIIKYKDIKFVSSGTRVFMNNVATKLKAYQDFAKQSGDGNLFLENVVIVFGKYGTATISFKTGVGLNPEDQIDLVTGFKQLNEYEMIGGKVSKIIPDSPTAISTFQEDLLRYSVLTSGLQYGGSGFSSYITPQLIQTLDDKTNIQISRLMNSPYTKGFRDHLALSYTLLNASKLGYILNEDLIPTSVDDKGKKTYPGVDTVEDKKVYFDLKAKRLENAKGELIEMPNYIRRTYGKNITVFKLVLATDKAAYYQKVGQSNDVVFKPVSQDSNFSLERQFTPYTPSVYYHYQENDKFISFSPLLNQLSVGDIAYIYPSYSYDRMERQKVKILAKTRSDLKGTEVKFEVVSEISAPPKASTPTKEDKIVISKSKYTRQSVESDKDTMYLFTDNAERTSAPNAADSNVDKSLWYYQKYESRTTKPIHYGTLGNPTSAVIRGLNNAYPISTMSAYGTNWTDANFELFKTIINDEIAQIKEDLSKFKTLKIGDYRIGQGGLKAKLPLQHQQYLDQKLLELGIDNSGTSPKIIEASSITYPETLPSEEAADYIVRLKELNYTEEQIGEALKLNCL